MNLRKLGVRLWQYSRVLFACQSSEVADNSLKRAQLSLEEMFGDWQCQWSAIQAPPNTAILAPPNTAILSPPNIAIHARTIQQYRPHPIQHHSNTVIHIPINAEMIIQAPPNAAMQQCSSQLNRLLPCMVFGIRETFRTYHVNMFSSADYYHAWFA